MLAALVMAGSVCSAQNKGGRGFVSFGASAGLAEDTVYLDVNQDIAVQLLPLDELVKVAVSHSPAVKYQGEVANALSSAHEVAKVQILQNLSGYVNYSTGNQSIISSGAAIVPGQDAIGQIANGYRVGVDVRLPLYELFGRKHQIRQVYSNYKAAVIQKDNVELQVRREVINVYYDMVTSQQLLKGFLLDEQASITALRVAETEIQKGQITADAMSVITNRYVQARAATEQARGSFLKNIHFFEALMGVPIQRLKRN